MQHIGSQGGASVVKNGLNEESSIKNDIVCISFYSNGIEKGMNPSSLRYG